MNAFNPASKNAHRFSAEEVGPEKFDREEFKRRFEALSPEHKEEFLRYLRELAARAGSEARS
ncbi:hypothetical protein C8J30_11574 [Rhodobacter viridis]|uniref:Uncharacterized protein n=1 Tax=Rhodobacter viridis TaxID=1054202 RepID=A0A318TVF2_9RHOB|nr:hypothetical protein [Rhodobacter viridis]PYF07827.1 hypothetical protein C8J30_11574 [Rhodobacter viridis]